MRIHAWFQGSRAPRKHSVRMSRHCSALSCEWGGARTATPSEAGKLRLSKGTRLPKIAKHHDLWLDLTPARSQGGTVGIPRTHLGPTLPLIQRCFFRQQPHPCRKSSTLCRDSQPHLPLPPPCPHGDPPPPLCILHIPLARGPQETIGRAAAPPEGRA